jgi:uncharacterized protein (DUF2147 family)
MKRLFACAAALAVMATGALADPVEGVWKTQVDDGHYAHITMSPCGDMICGVISQAFDANGPIKSDNIGKQLVWDMKIKGKGAYNKGKIWQPSTDKVFNSKMALSGDVLKVSGCVGPICKNQTWTRTQ